MPLHLNECNILPSNNIDTIFSMLKSGIIDRFQVASVAFLALNCYKIYVETFNVFLHSKSSHENKVH